MSSDNSSDAGVMADPWGFVASGFRTGNQRCRNLCGLLSILCLIVILAMLVNRNDNTIRVPEFCRDPCLISERGCAALL